jgi:hypothetical protein
MEDKVDLAELVAQEVQIQIRLQVAGQDMVHIVEEAKEVAAAEAALVVMETVKTVAQEVANVAEMVEVLFHFQYLDQLLIMQVEAEQAGLMVVEDGVLVEEQELAEEHKIQAQEVAPA